MTKKPMILIVLAGLLFFTGCNIIAPATVQPGITDAELATLMANATQQAAITPVLILPTDTPAAVLVTATLPPTTSGSITITSILETAPGRAIVSWDAVGDFSSGYRVVWTDVQGMPTFPENTSVYTSDPYARSAMISGITGKIYYVRVCRSIGDGCDLYSNLGIFAFFGSSSPISATATMLALLTPKATYVSGGSGSGSGNIVSSLKIVEMTGGLDGKAYMRWESSVNPTKGFKILYSKTNNTPTLGTDPYFFIADNAARYAWVDGVQGTKYYYRICRFDGTKCETYSPVYTYTFPGTPPLKPTATTDPAVIDITSVTDYDPGVVQVDWTATGTFPSGFKVLYSKTNPLPTLSDSSVAVSDGALRTTLVKVQPGQQYYFRVCKYNSGCVAYSPAVTFTPAAAAEETGFTLTAGDTVAGAVELFWEIATNSAGGYKILWSQENPVPANAFKGFVSDPTIHTYVDADMPGGSTIFAKICRWSGSWCLSYSNTLAIDVLLP
jgi:hypothetical protein